MPDSVRPTSLIPLNEAHEFLNEPLELYDPVLQAWIRHFTHVRVAFRMGKLSGRFMLYTHRIAPRDPAVRGVRWCCKSNGRRPALSTRRTPPTRTPFRARA